MRRIYLPVLLANLPEARARAFVVLFTCEALTRSLLITLVPLQAYAAYNAAQTVSVIYFLAAIVGLGGSLLVPSLIARLHRRWVMTLGCGFQFTGVALLMAGTPETLAMGLAFQVLSTAILEVVINLYMLDHVPRRELNTFEPRRLLFTGVAFAVGPWLGVQLHREVLIGLTHLIALVTSIVMLVFFWRLRLSDDPTFQAATSKPASPLVSIPRYVKQPRLVLAWVLALGRNCWWVTFFIYTPIYIASAGYSPHVSGAVVSLGLVGMLFVPFWGRVGRRVGIRKLLAAGYGVTGLATLAAAVAGLAGQPVGVMVCIWAATIGATVIDGAGNVPFLRAVHPYERAAMTSVFMTYRHFAALVVPGVLAALLLFLPVPFAFAFSGTAMIAMALLSQALPRRL
ncbi:MAG: MFS transporter [Hyphomicrobiaceae bacterium]|nr:MFS transporter [Hyphomicrobiaceae bacterium]